MTGLKIQAFGGMAPAVDDRLLRDNSAAWAENTWLYKGRLSGIPQKTRVKTLTAGTAKVFRIPNGLPDTTHIDDSTWLEFSDPDTDVVRALVIGDTYDRYYWASSADVPRYNTKARIASGAPAWKLGIPAPTISSITKSGGTGAARAAAYIATWVSAYGEEGPASAPYSITGKVDDTYAITLAAASSTDTGGDNGDDRYLTKVRIYRTVTSSSGVTTYFLVVEQNISTTTYNDTSSDATISANNQLESTLWTAPPTDLRGMVAMPNGILAGFRENEVWFSEPYHPHAWPAAYVVVVDFPIVGLGVTNQSLIVCTKGYPVSVSGVNPASMTVSKSSSLEPCMSRGSILSTTEGVYYASPNGLVLAGAGAITNITKNLITKDEWRRLVRTETLRAGRIGTGYFAFGSAQAGSFDSASFATTAFAQYDETGSYQGILLDPSDERTGFTMMSNSLPTKWVGNDIWSGELFFTQGTANLFTYSEMIGSWANNGNISVTSNAIIAPDGTLSADKLIENTSSSVSHAAGQTVTSAIGDQFVVSWYAKAGERRYVAFNEYGTLAFYKFDLLNGLALSAHSTIEDFGNGWFRCSVAFTKTNSYQIFQICPLNDSQQPFYTGDGASGLYVWGAQIETGSVLTTYTPTTAAAGQDASTLYRIDISETDPVRRNYLWRSKIFQVPKKNNLGAMKVYWQANAAAPANESTPPATSDTNTAEFPSLPSGTTYGVVRVYGDGELKLTRELLTSGELIRLTSGFKADYWQLEFETYVDILSVQVASSARELANG